MALKKGLPAIQARWLWDWQRRGSVRVESLLGTRVLIVQENGRPSKTYHRERDGKVTKETVRYWLGQGIILVPRWDLLDFHCDPVTDEGVKSLALNELKQRGMYRLKDGTILVLIYQHVEDTLHFQRQQWHIRLERYAAELQKISTLLAEIEKRALTRISLRKAPGIEPTGELGRLMRHYQHRRGEIHQILVYIAPRERAAEILVHTLRRELQLNQKGIQGILSSKPMKDLLASVPAPIEGMKAYLVKIYLNLNQMKVRPIVQPLKLAQHYLRGALGALDVGEPGRVVRQLELATENLRKAEQSLQHPKEKMTRFQSAAA